MKAVSIAGVLLAALVGFSAFSFESSPTPVSEANTAAAYQASDAVPEASVPTAKPVNTQGKYYSEGAYYAQKSYYTEGAYKTGSVELSNDTYYTNSEGNQVHSPAYADDVPPGASARCRDGTYSFSQNRRGTCSHHGGVAEWL